LETAPDPRRQIPSASTPCFPQPGDPLAYMLGGRFLAVVRTFVPSC
jgi:hypothetical protein